jgi:hypothetical protein
MLLIVFSSAIVYTPALLLGMISDDFSLIELARRSTLHSLFLDVGVGFYRPLVQLSFLLDYSFWLSEPFGYHATNLLLHLINISFVCLIARKVLGDAVLGWVVCGFYFGITPTHATSVLWICGRTDLLCAMFYLLAVWSFLCVMQGADRRFLFVSCLGTFLALLSKEMALSLPLVCFLIALTKQPDKALGLRVLDSIRSSAPILLIVVGYLGFRYSLFGTLPQSPVHETATLTSLLTNLPRYVLGLVVPTDLEAIKPFFRANPKAFLAASALLSVVFLIAALKFARDRILLALLACVCITVLPVVRVFAPWYLYIPSVGTALMVGRLATLIPKKSLQQVWLRSLVVILLVVHLYGLGQAQSRGYTSGTLTANVVDTLRRTVPKNGRVVVLSLPAEYRGVPVFSWLGNLTYAMRLFEHPIDVETLVGVHLTDVKTESEISVDDAGHIHLAILGERDFFRLQDLGMMTGARKPSVGLTFSTRHAQVEVKALNASGQASRLKVIPKSFLVSDPNVRVFAFFDGALREI